MRVERYCEALRSASENKLDDLVLAASQGLWQAPSSYISDLNVSEYRVLKRAADALVKRGQTEQAFLVGTRLRDCQGGYMHHLVGTAARIKARRNGWKSPDFPTDETLREAARGEILRFAIPSVREDAIVKIPEPDPDVPARFYAAHHALRIQFGGRTAIVDRAEAVERYRLVLERIEEDCSALSLMRWCREEAPFAPLDAMDGLGSPTRLLLWTWRGKPSEPNALGKLLVASTYHSLATLRRTHEKERTFRPSVIRIVKP